jgi:hypothetical protein
MNTPKFTRSVEHSSVKYAQRQYGDGTLAGDKKRVRLKRLRVVSVVVAGKAARGGCIAVLKRHVAERWCGVSLKVP